jgi:vanillate/3-O-methylgallate O-demethylase
MYRYQVNGPKTLPIVEAAHGGPIEPIKFFHMAEFTIAGRTVRALNHTMAGVPGLESTGLELMGPAVDGPVALQALVEAGREFGLRRGGARSYLSTARESGWIPLIVPAIYTGAEMQPYRQWLSAQTFEGNASLEGSFDSERIEDYYATPWALGYGNLIKFDHEFIGRAALEALVDQPHRKKVWLRWNNDDVARIMSDALFGTGMRPKIIDVPNAEVGTFIFDSVLVGGRIVGLSTWGGYSANLGGFLSLGMIDEAEAQDGAEVSFLWGQHDGGTSKPFMPPHVQTEIRATISTRLPL